MADSIHHHVEGVEYLPPFVQIAVELVAITRYPNNDPEDPAGDEIHLYYKPKETT